MKYDEIVKQFQNNIFGTLTTIRSNKEHNKIWFLAPEIQKLLEHSNLRQAIKDAKLQPDEIFLFKKSTSPLFFDEVRKQCLRTSCNKLPSITFISESGLYKLIMRSNKPEAEKFSNWVTKVVLPNLREGVEKDLIFKNASELVIRHLDVAHQKYESKRVNRKIIQSSGVNGAITYNRNSCLDHSGMTPKKLKTLAKEKGIPASKRTSGKEVLRIIDMPTASSMSFTDSLVSDGVPYTEALKVSNGAGKELFKQMLQVGIKPAELNR